MICFLMGKICTRGFMCSAVCFSGCKIPLGYVSGGAWCVLGVLVGVLNVLEGVLEPREPLGGPIRHADFLHVTAFY